MEEETFCTFAATGPNPTFQEVYICHTCYTKTPTTSSTNQDKENQNDNDDNEMIMPLCICTNCANACHIELGHDVEFIGLGPSYCDCSSIPRTTTNGTSGCQCVLEQVSKEAASQLGIQTNNDGTTKRRRRSIINIPLPSSSCIRIEEEEEEEKQSSNFPYQFSIHTIPSLLLQHYESRIQQRVSEPKPNFCYNLIQQSLELIKHTKDTHWIPFHIDEETKQINVDHQEEKEEEVIADEDKWCDLEKLASCIFRHHIQTHNLQDLLDGGGAEWWVQVKNNNNDDDDDSGGDDGGGDDDEKKEAAIDLHYDKDEELASTFNLGSFPTLSTVTYLTDATNNNMCSNENQDCDSSSRRRLQLSTLPPAPTLVFAHTFDMPDNGPIMGGGRGNDDDDADDDGEEGRSSITKPQVLISHARAGKHLCFDGRLLHGAPSNTELRLSGGGGKGGQSTTTTTKYDNRQPSNDDGDDETQSNVGLRVTFLVNIWLTSRPSKVSILPSHIRSRINSCVEHIPDDILSSSFTMKKRDVVDIIQSEVTEEDDNRILLPFVSTGAAWIDNDENSDDESGEVGLVVSMLPPPSYDHDTVLVCYAPGLEPSLEHIGMDDEEEIDDDNDDEISD